MQTVVIATQNPGKAKEFKEMFHPFGIEVKTLLDFPEIADIEETGTTFEENAIIKATQAAKKIGHSVIADDSGLTIDALYGEPGVYSARYSGEEKNDARNRQKVLENMKEVPEEKRQAQFHCVLAISDAKGNIVRIYHGTLEGVILETERGENGFGYDSIFYVPNKKKTTAEMTASEKSAISHRGNALRLLEKDLKEGKVHLE